MQTTRVFLRIGVILGALFTCAPLLGILGVSLKISRLHHPLGRSGISDPHQLSTGVARTMLVTGGGFVLLPFGIVLLTVCLLLLRRLRQAGPPPLPVFQKTNKSHKKGLTDP